MWPVPRVHVVRSVAMGSRSVPRRRWMVTWGCGLVVTGHTTPREHTLEAGRGPAHAARHWTVSTRRRAGTRGVWYNLFRTPITGAGRPLMAAAHAPSHVLVVQFVAALLQRTLGCPTVEGHQHALQSFLDDLTPW